MALALGVVVAACGQATSQPRASHDPSPRSSNALVGDLGLARVGAQSLLARAVAAARPHAQPAGSRAADQFQDIQYAAGIYNAGSRRPFVVFWTTRYAVTVWPSSSAQVTKSSVAPAAFARPRDLNNWRASGSTVPLSRPADSVQRYKPSEFSLLPVGTTLTYQEARDLPGSPSAMRDAVARHLGPPSGASPPAPLLLQVYGFLLATAPISPAARRALFADIASLPGLRTCGIETDLLHRRAPTVCATDSRFETDLLIDTGTGSVLGVEQRVRQRSVAFAGLSPRSVIQFDTFAGGT